MQQKVTFNSHTHAEPQAHMGGRVGLRCTRWRGDGGGRMSAYVLCVGTESTFFMISSLHNYDRFAAMAYLYINPCLLAAISG
jgi:hypothetical protein